MPLSPRQIRFYLHTVDVWRATVNPPGADGKFAGRGWAHVGTAVRCKIVMQGGPLGPAGGVIMAEGQELMTMDKIHFALDADVKVNDEVKVVGPTGGALAGNWWKLVEEPEVREWRANKVEIMAIRIEAPSPGAG